MPSSPSGRQQIELLQVIYKFFKSEGVHAYCQPLPFFAASQTLPQQAFRNLTSIIHSNGKSSSPVAGG